jgi:hypothetical protein
MKLKILQNDLLPAKLSSVLQRVLQNELLQRFTFYFWLPMAFLLKWLLLFHPFYVSLVQIDHNPKTAELEISVRSFTSDLEATLRKNYPAAKIDLLSKNASQKEADDVLINRYLAGKLKVWVDGKPYNLHFVGRERLEENTWAYFEIEGIKSLKKLHLSNKIMYDWQPQQSNMHEVKYAGQQKTWKLDNPESEIDFSF